jgi:serine protease Do
MITNNHKINIIIVIGKTANYYIMQIRQGGNHMSKSKIMKHIAGLLVIALICGIGIYGVGKVSSDAQKKTDQITGVEAEVTTSVENDGVSQVAEAVLPSIVQVHVTTVQTVSDFFGNEYRQEQPGMGSGVIVGQDKETAYIVTNSHVIQGSTKVEIQFNDESKVSASVKGSDSINDLAVVAVKLSDLSKETISHIRVAQFGSSDEAKVGQQVIAIGNALGYGTSVTVGYLSAKEREVDFEDGTRILLQTDAAINPGNSGGALVDSTGRMIGINCGGVVAVEVEGIKYAIPISDAIPIIKRLMTQEPKDESEKAYLGITGKEITSDISESYNIPEGVYIDNVTEGSPAEEAGLKSGDILTAVDGNEIYNTIQLQEQLAEKEPGESIILTIETDRGVGYSEDEVRVVLGSRSEVNTQPE